MAERRSSINAPNVLAVAFLVAVFGGYVLFEEEVEAFFGSDAERCAWAEQKVVETRSPLWEGYARTTCEGVRP